MSKYIVKAGGSQNYISLDKFEYTANNVFIDKNHIVGPFYPQQNSSYILLPDPFNYTKSFEIVINYLPTTAAPRDYKNGLIGGKSGWQSAPSIEVGNNTIWCGLSYTGSIWNINIKATYEFEIGKEYFIKLCHNVDTKKFSLYISKDNDKHYELIQEVENVSISYQNQKAVFEFGNANSDEGTSSHSLQYGKINLYKTYILTDNKLFWGVNYGAFET